VLSMELTLNPAPYKPKGPAPKILSAAKPLPHPPGAGLTYVMHEVDSKPGPFQTKGSTTQSVPIR
jgi:hypothetical protein